jgi:hypothetical protein
MVPNLRIALGALVLLIGPDTAFVSFDVLSLAVPNPSISLDHNPKQDHGLRVPKEGGTTLEQASQ